VGSSTSHNLKVVTGIALLYFTKADLPTSIGRSKSTIHQENGYEKLVFKNRSTFWDIT
jgi:hypothetical protein